MKPRSTFAMGLGIGLCLAGLAYASSPAYVFQDGQIISAGQLNANFQELHNKVNTQNGMEIRARVVECHGNCWDEGTPNGLCRAAYGDPWKALAVDCEVVEVPTITGQTYIDRTMDSYLDWCGDSVGEDMIIMCFR